MNNYTGEVTVNVVRKGEKYLMAKRSADGYWEFVGGKVERGETVKKTALRELKEETGLYAEVLKFGEGYPSEDDSKWLLVPILMEAESYDVELGEEHTDYKWLSLTEFQNYSTLGQYKALEQLDIVKGDVATVISEYDKKYLILRRSKHTSSTGYWNFPGGSIEEGESRHEAALRELKEETGLTGEIIDEGGWFISQGELGYWRVYPFLASLEEKGVELNEEHSDYKWIEIKRVEELKTLGSGKSLESLGLT